MSAALTFKPGRDKSVRRCHPWTFSGAVDQVHDCPGLGETVAVLSSHGEPLGWAAFSPQSQIRARMWSWDPAETITEEFFYQRVRQAVRWRADLFPDHLLQAVRLCHAESDALSGVVVDRYADWLVVQWLTAGAERWREVIVAALVAETDIHQVYERSDVEVRRLEGLEERVGLVQGGPPERVCIEENGLRFWVDFQRGQKTGFYLDQRRNRQRVRELAAGRRVLNCFCYSGAFINIEPK